MEYDKQGVPNFIKEADKQGKTEANHTLNEGQSIFPNPSLITHDLSKGEGTRRSRASQKNR